MFSLHICPLQTSVVWFLWKQKLCAKRSCYSWQDLIFPKIYSTVAQRELLDAERCRAILQQYCVFWSKEEELLIREQLQVLLWVEPINDSVIGRSLTVAKTLCNLQGAWDQFEVFPLPILRWPRKERFELNSWLQHLSMYVSISVCEYFFTYLGLIFVISYLVTIPCWVY